MVLGASTGGQTVVSTLRIGFTGHQGLTPETELAVRKEIAEYLVDIPDFVGLSSLAEGSDQIFANEVLAHNGVLEVLIPCNHYIETFDSDNALRRYESLRSKARLVDELPFDGPSEEAFWAAGKRGVEQSDVLVAVWNGKPAAGLGGAGDVVDYARKLGKGVHIIWPTGAARL